MERELTEIEKAFIAGFFEGEGCVLVQRKKNNRGVRFGYTLHVMVTQNETEMLEFLRSMLDTASDLPPIIITTPSTRILEALVGNHHGVQISGDAVHTERVVAAVKRVAGQQKP